MTAAQRSAFALFVIATEERALRVAGELTRAGFGAIIADMTRGARAAPDLPASKNCPEGLSAATVVSGGP
jgi:hypothetical protein